MSAAGHYYYRQADRLLADFTSPDDLDTPDPPVALALAQAYATLAVAERLGEVVDRLAEVADQINGLVGVIEEPGGAR